MKTEMNAKEQKYVEKIIKKYSEKEETKLDLLRELDKKTKRGANIFSYIFGSIGALILGLGMCIAMKVILEDFMIIGIVIGLVGILMVSVNYHIYKRILERSRRKHANEVLELSKELLNE